MMSDDEDYELMQLQTEPLYCEVPDIPPIKDNVIDTRHYRSKSTSSFPTSSTNCHQKRPSLCYDKDTRTTQVNTTSPKPKPRLKQRSKTENSFDNVSNGSTEGQRKGISSPLPPTARPHSCTSPPSPPPSPSLTNNTKSKKQYYTSQTSTGFGLEQFKGLQLKDFSIELPSQIAESSSENQYNEIPPVGTYVNIDEMNQTEIDKRDLKKITNELIASREREEKLLKRIDEQDHKIATLHQSIESLKVEFKKLLTVLTTTTSVPSPLSLPQSNIVTPPLYLSPIRHPPCEFIMSNFSHYQYNPDKEWYSEPFYSSDQFGYKMCLQVVANGMGASTGRDVSICIKLMSGEFDHQLMFPFYGDIKVDIVNSLGDYKHASRVISFDGEAMKYGACRRVKTGSCDAICVERAELGWGITAFIPHSYLHYNSKQKTQFISNDSMTIRIASVVVTNAPQF